MDENLVVERLIKLSAIRCYFRISKFLTFEAYQISRELHICARPVSILNIYHFYDILKMSTPVLSALNNIQSPYLYSKHFAYLKSTLFLTKNLSELFIYGIFSINVLRCQFLPTMKTGFSAKRSRFQENFCFEFAVHFFKLLCSP